MMNNRWQKSYVYVFYGWFRRHKTTQSSNFIIFYQIEQNHWVEKQKSNNSNIERKKLTDILKNDFFAYEEHFGQIVSRKIITCPEEFLVGFLAKNIWKIFSHFVRKCFGWFSQIDISVSMINLGRIGTLKTS